MEFLDRGLQNSARNKIIIKPSKYLIKSDFAVTLNSVPNISTNV